VTAGALPAGFEDATAPVKDIEMHYVQGGSGDPLVIIHGGWDCWWAWREIIPTLAERRTVILPALRGLAQTSKPAGGYDGDNVGDDVYQLLRQLGHERFALVGHDWGGLAAYALAAQHPDAVERLAIFEMVIPGTGILEQAIIPAPNGAYLWHFGLHSVPDIPELLIEGHLREYMKWFFTAGAARDDAVSDESLDRYVELYSQPGAIPAFLAYYRSFWTHGEQVRAHMTNRLAMPVLAYGGAASIGAGVEACMRMLADDVQGGVISDCGHWVAEEQPAVVLELLEAFLGNDRPHVQRGTGA
jgi:pimeloyl-ACP methyl ester carboxylesterase